MVWPFSPKWPEKTVADVDGKSYDYVIVGGGTSACVLAARLTEDPSVSVLVISRGQVKDSLLLKSPLFGQSLRAKDPQGSLLYSQPDERWSGQQVLSFTSRAVGGATRVNGLMLTRGAPANYDLWAEMGNDEWSWAKCEPWFRKIENASLVSPPGSPYRGHDGPLVVRHTGAPSPFEIDKYWERAAEDIGIPICKDANDPQAPATGMFPIDTMIDPPGYRLGVLEAYLPSSVARERSNRLTLCTGALATKLEFDDAGSVVTGVRLIDADTKERTGRQCSVKAKREVIVCCGALFSPQFLMLSGVGSKVELESHNIPVVHDLPGVGSNLSDHVAFGVAFEVLVADSYIQLLNPFVAIWHLLVWLFFKTGLFAATTTRHALWLHSDTVDDKTMTVKRQGNDSKDRFDASRVENIPNIEFMFTGASYDEEYDKKKGYAGIFVTLAQPFSRGRIALDSDDPFADPKMHHPLITDERDWAVARKAARLATHFLERCRDKGYPFETIWHRAPGVKPGTVDGTWKDASDEEVDDFVRQRLHSALHLTSTCRMASKADGGVVGQDLKVYGVKNLRVADASIFPALTSAHTVAPTYVVAERCADFIKRDWASK